MRTLLGGTDCRPTGMNIFFRKINSIAAEAAESGSPSQRYDFVSVDQTGFEKHAPKNFAARAASFTEYKN
jgi:hypothetical protein